MSAYDDLIPSTSPSRRRSAYDDLLPGGAPAATVQPAEDARPTGDEAVTELGSAVRRAAIAAEPAVTAITPALKTVQAIASGYPVAETAGNLLTGSFAFPVSGIAGLAAVAAKAAGYNVEPGDVVHKTQEALTYQPKTKLGEHLTSAVLYPIEKLQELGKFAGEKTQDVGGSPGVATAAETAVNAPLVLGFRKALRDARMAEQARVAEAVPAEPAPVVAAAEPVRQLEPPVVQPEAIHAKRIETKPPAAPESGAPPAPVVRETAYTDLVPKAEVKEPWQVAQQYQAALGVDHPDIRSMLEQMSGEAGWAEVGGRLIRRKRSEVAGDEEISRTSWIPKAEWWPGRPGKLNEARTAEAVRKTIAGEPLKKREQEAIDYMVEVANERVADRARIGTEEWSGIAEDIKADGLQPSHRNVLEADLVSRAVTLDEAAVERAAVKHENNDAAFRAEVQRIIDEHEAKTKSAAQGREANRGAAQESGAGFDLTRQTEAELAAREAARKEAEARRITAEQTAERKRAADAQRGDFTLAGSDRAADVNPKQTSLLGMPAGTAVAPAAEAGVAPLPPKSSARSVPTEQARPDAIRKAMAELFGTVLSEKYQGAKNLGIYRVKPQTIRLRDRNDLRTASHEVGHHISETNRAFRSVMKQHAGELIPMMPAAYKQKIAQGTPIPRKLQIEEGFAEFIAEYLGDRPVAQSKAPQFYKAFEGWLEQNPRYETALQQVADMLGAHEALSPETKILAKVGVYKAPLRERAGALVSKETWNSAVQATLDKWHPLKLMVEDLQPGLAPSKNPYATARLLAGDAAIIEDWVSNFTSPYDYQKRLDPKNYGQSLKAILQPILEGGGAEINKFKAYLIARRAAELKKVGKENLFTSEEIAAGLRLETAQFKKVAGDVYAYNDRLLNYAVEGGLLSPEVAAKFKQYTAYIPFFREPEGAAGTGGRGEPFKRLAGGTQNVRDPIANMIQNTANIVHATNRNAVLQKAVELAKAVPGGGRWLETVPLPQQAHSLATKRIIDQLREQGVQVDTQMAENLAAMQTFFTKSGRGDDRTRTIVYKAAGELKAVQVNDPLLWKAIGNMPPLEMGLIVKMLAFPASTLRAGVVLDPTFMVRNFVRDTLTAMIQSKGTFLPVVSTAQGIKMMAQQKDAYRMWRAFGGAFADQFREPQEAAAIIQRMAKRGNFSPASIISPWRLLDALKKVGSFSESGSRIGEFAATYKKGDFDSALQAALNSREVSTDFGMRGGADAVQVLTRITPFMNPAMQGLYKTARVVTGADGRRTMLKAATIGSGMALASIALALLNSDEDWYQSLEEWEKVTYWHVKLGDDVYRLAKPFEYGALFASIPESIALLQQGKENWQDFKARTLQVLGQVFGFRVIPQAATIVAEPWANKSIFTGRKLVPDRQERLEPGLQAHPYTSKVAQAAGEAANVSPAVIDNMVRNMFGTLGVHAATVADLMLEQTGAFPPGRERGWQTWPALKAFVRDPDNPNSKQQRDFYEQLEKYRRAVNTVKEYRNRGEDVKAERYAEGKADEISMAKHAERAAQRLAKIRKAIRAIDWDRDMSPAEKREAINEHNDEVQDIAREQTLLYQAAKKSYIRPATEGGQK